VTPELSKKHIRDEVRAGLSVIESPQYQLKSQQICARLMKMPLWNDVSTVHVFIPVLARREPNIRPFILHLMSKGIKIVLPVVKIFSRGPAAKPRLQHVAVTSLEDFAVNRWGISEPENGVPQHISDIDVVVVPAVAVDPKGNRLGTGFGYYDEFLAEVTCPRVCPILSNAYVERIPAEPHDIGMTYIITESDTLDLSGT